MNIFATIMFICCFVIIISDFILEPKKRKTFCPICHSRLCWSFIEKRKSYTCKNIGYKLGRPTIIESPCSYSIDYIVYFCPEDISHYYKEKPMGLDGF